MITCPRVYAAYGGVFIVLSVLWGWGIDKKTPDIYDWIGAAICLVGVSVMLLAPRHLKHRDDEYLDIQARHWVSPPWSCTFLYIRCIA